MLIGAGATWQVIADAVAAALPELHQVPDPRAIAATLRKGPLHTSLARCDESDRSGQSTAEFTSQGCDQGLAVGGSIPSGAQDAYAGAIPQRLLYRRQLKASGLHDRDCRCLRPQGRLPEFPNLVFRLAIQQPPIIRLRLAHPGRGALEEAAPRLLYVPHKEGQVAQAQRAKLRGSEAVRMQLWVLSQQPLDRGRRRRSTRHGRVWSPEGRTAGGA
mmetsp:Transcript_100557/g.224693  ORF Transcript_100557/g.224693 Transcript_100557/m.224693 type:complete len:216 (+) Transcript_100557:821-1468(+)